MRTLLASAGLGLLLTLATQPSVSAQEPPAWMKQTVPDQALKPHWDEQLAVMNPKGALDGKTKHLIAIAVAAQIPGTYCVYGNTKWAKAAGATDAQIKEAIATAALVRSIALGAVPPGLPRARPRPLTPVPPPVSQNADRGA